MERSQRAKTNQRKVKRATEKKTKMRAEQQNESLAVTNKCERHRKMYLSFLPLE